MKISELAEDNSEMVHFQSFADKQGLADHLAQDVARMLSKAIEARGKASLVVSGGSTPKPFFAALKEQDVQWDKVYVTLADERWVPEDHEASNARLLRENLLVDGMHFVPLANDAGSPEEGLATTAKALKAVPHPFDVVILGMGDDGHTASLFPEADELDHALTVPLHEAVCAPMHPKHAPHARITLTYLALLHSRQIILHITGQNKLDVFEEASAPGPVEDKPIRAFLRQDAVPVDVYWSA